MIDAAILPANTDQPEEPADPGKVRILVVDDDERNLIAARSILEDTAEVVTVTSGEEALRELLLGSFAVILLDVIMPGMDGYETASLIRGRKQTKHVPIIFLSAINKDTPHLMRGYSMGAVDYVFKPVEPLILRSKVRVFVELFRMSREIEAKAAREKALLDETLRAQAERLAAERDLRASEARQVAVMESLPIALYVANDGTDVERTIVAGTIAGLVSAEDRGIPRGFAHWLERVHPEDRERVAAAADLCTKDGRNSIEYRLAGADGGYRHVLDQCVRLEGDESVFAGTVLDISDRKLLEEQLLQAQKMDALGKLTGGIAHDFNNLLAAVIGGIGILERRASLTDEQKHIAEMTKNAANQGAELVKRLMAFSRIQRLEPSRVDLSQMATEVEHLLAHSLGGLVTLEWDIDDKAWEPYADRSQLQLAVMNLAINARDAMPEGGTIRISSRNRRLKGQNEYGLAPGEYLTITVADEGHGMSDDVLSQVMEPFFTTKESGKGTGLGLSMVYGFARQSGGTIDIESNLDEGTRVHIWLPRASALADTSPANGLAQADAATARLDSLRVLLVDDHDGVRLTTAALLRDLGATVADHADGEAMLSQLEAEPEQYDVILTDYAMPGMAGDEAIRRARKIVSSMPAVIVTGHASPRALGSLPERTVLLNKPFTPAKLVHALRSSMEMRDKA